MRPQFVAAMAALFILFLILYNGKAAQGLHRDLIHTREYQFDVDMEGYYLYDGKNYLGFVPFGTSPVLDSLIIQDNQ